ncbi:carbohydrate kinase family protein [Arthrobacter pigmenti]
MKIVGIGDNVVDCYPQFDRMYPGGNALNVAVYSRRCGVETAYAGAVGSDTAGRLITGSLSAENVDSSRLRTIPGPTGHASVELVNGEREFPRGDKGVSLFTPETADLELLASATLAHSSCYSGLEEYLPWLAAEAPLSFDFSDESRDGGVEALLPHIAVASFSANDLDRDEALELAAWAHSRGPSHVLVTRGLNGSIYFDGNEFHEQPAHSVETIDSLGAGDAFIARMLVGLLENEMPAVFLAAAAALAAQTCLQHGAFGYGTPIPPELSSTMSTAENYSGTNRTPRLKEAQ